MSRPSEPVGIVSISTACLPLSRMIEPLPKARSIWDRAASSALVLSTEGPSTTRRFGWLTAGFLLARAARETQRSDATSRRDVDGQSVHALFAPTSSFFVRAGARPNGQA